MSEVLEKSIDISDHQPDTNEWYLRFMFVKHQLQHVEKLARELDINTAVAYRSAIKMMEDAEAVQL